MGFCPHGVTSREWRASWNPLWGSPEVPRSSHLAQHFPLLQVPFIFPPWVVCFGKEPRRKKTNSSWVSLTRASPTPGQASGHCLDGLQTGNEGFAPEAGAPDGLLSSVPRALATPGTHFSLCPLGVASLMAESRACQGTARLLGRSFWSRRSEGRGLGGKPRPQGDTGLSRGAFMSVCVCTSLKSLSLSTHIAGQISVGARDREGKVGAGDPAEPSLCPGAAMWGMSMPDWPDHTGCGGDSTCDWEWGAASAPSWPLIPGPGGTLLPQPAPPSPRDCGPGLGGSTSPSPHQRAHGPDSGVPKSRLAAGHLARPTSDGRLLGHFFASWIEGCTPGSLLSVEGATVAASQPRGSHNGLKK